MKLKTLKDLGYWKSEITLYDEIYKGEDISTKELKQAAIEWVKELSKDRTDNGVVIKEYKTIKWIIKFFNLTKEDLK
jgi:hypothetical protein